MPARNARSRARALGASAALFALSVVVFAPRAVGQELPPDDGAPPSDDEPTTESRTSAVDTAAEAASALPASPPRDNAFPIIGRTRSVCSDSFGDPRSGGRTHMGVDCFAPRGTPLLAVETGTIRYAELGAPFDCSAGGDISGNRVSLRGRSGYVYYYGHLESIYVAAEQEVQEGDVIGTVGNTGNAACSSPHLHFEVKCGSGGDPFDPYPWMATWGSPSPPPPGPPSTELFGGGVAFTGPNRQDLFVLECGEVIRQRTWYSSIGLTSGWAAVDGIATSDPDSASAGTGALPQTFVRGTDNAVYLLNWNGSAWSALSLGGICTSGPTAAYPSPTHLDVFCRGTDMAIYHRSWDAGTGLSQGWAKVGGIATSDPDAAPAGPEYTADVFVRGTDGAAWLLYETESGWAGLSLGGNCTSGPSAAYSGPDRFDVFCRGTDLALWHRSWRRATGWSAAWSRIESRVLSDPEAASVGSGGAAQVFARGVDRRIYQFQWTGSTWVSWVWGVT